MHFFQLSRISEITCIYNLYRCCIGTYVVHTYAYIQQVLFKIYNSNAFICKLDETETSSNVIKSMKGLQKILTRTTYRKVITLVSIFQFPVKVINLPESPVVYNTRLRDDPTWPQAQR